MRSHKDAVIRRARVALSPDNMRKLLKGESLHIRLHNVIGEEQILELQSPCTSPSAKSVQNMAQDMIDAFNDLMDITGKGAPANGKDNSKRNRGRRMDKQA